MQPLVFVMEEFTITLTSGTVQQLRERCAELGVKPEDIIRANVEEFLLGPSEEFRAMVDYVLKKNLELYKRLA